MLRWKQFVVVFILLPSPATPHSRFFPAPLSPPRPACVPRSSHPCLYLLPAFSVSHCLFVFFSPSSVYCCDNILPSHPSTPFFQSHFPMFNLSSLWLYPHPMFSVLTPPSFLPIVLFFFVCCHGNVLHSPSALYVSVSHPYVCCHGNFPHSYPPSPYVTSLTLLHPHPPFPLSQSVYTHNSATFPRRTTSRIDPTSQLVDRHRWERRCDHFSLPSKPPSSIDCHAG